MIGVLFRSCWHDVHLFLIDMIFLKCTQSGFTCAILAVHGVGVISWQLYNWFCDLIQFYRSPSVNHGFCACVACCVKSDVSLQWLMRNTYLPAMCLQCDGGGDVSETWWRHSLAACRFKDRIVRGWVMQELESSQQWETMWDEFIGGLLKNNQQQTYCLKGHHQVIHYNLRNTLKICLNQAWGWL